MARLRMAGRLDPGARLFCLAFISSSVLFLRASSATFCFLALMLMLWMEGIALALIGRDFLYVLALGLFLFLVESVGWNSGRLRLGTGRWLEIYTFAIKLGVAFMAGRLFYASTSSSELRIAAIRVGRFLPKMLRSKTALALVLILGLIPSIMGDWRETILSAKSRGLSRKSRLSTWASMLSAYIRRLMIRAVRLPEVLASRGWDERSATSESRLDPWRRRDWIASMGSLGALLLAAAIK